MTTPSFARPIPLTGISPHAKTAGQKGAAPQGARLAELPQQRLANVNVMT